MTFTVYGVPQPKGSTRAFVPKGWTHAVVTSANPKNKAWQQLVAEAAGRAMAGRKMFVGPVSVQVYFYLARPKAIKNKAVPHVKKPDVDKLTRSCLDAMTKVVWQDDSQVVDLHAVKGYANPQEPPHATISVEECSFP